MKLHAICTEKCCYLVFDENITTKLLDYVSTAMAFAGLYILHLHSQIRTELNINRERHRSEYDKL
jgi:hypothetical protein